MKLIIISSKKMHVKKDNTCAKAMISLWVRRFEPEIPFLPSINWFFTSFRTFSRRCCIFLHHLNNREAEFLTRKGFLSSRGWHLRFSPLLNLNMVVHCAALSSFLHLHHQYTYNRNAEAQRIVYQPGKVYKNRITYLIRNEKS